MDRAVTAVHTADRALNALESLLALPPTTEIERDSALQGLIRGGVESRAGRARILT